MKGKTHVAVVPFELAHYARLPVRPEQQDDLKRMGELTLNAAALGPAFSAVEVDEDGAIVAVLACAGLAETRAPGHPQGGYATAWAAFSESLRWGQWAALTAAIRGVIEAADYDRIDMLVRPDFPAAERYAEALGFTKCSLIYARQRERASVQVEG